MAIADACVRGVARDVDGVRRAILKSLCESRANTDFSQNSAALGVVKAIAAACAA
ncbi:MAG TPA: hypothetical protein VMB81_15080 [Candidatus Sulfotelmatobacter sp.]|nr:hypothetical protein [Candidatus Sulfotelmatobacter sp.]